MLNQCVGLAKRVGISERSGWRPKGKKSISTRRVGPGTASIGMTRRNSCSGGMCKTPEQEKLLRWGSSVPALPAELETNPFVATTHVPKTPEKLHVREFGTGSSNVLMLHGLSQTGEAWRPLLENMNLRQFRYICPDLLGHGESSCTPYLKYTPNTHLHFLQRDVVNKIGHGSGQDSGIVSHAPFRLVGVGLGAILALELASRMPFRVTSLHLISLPAYEDEKEASEDLLSHLIHPLAQFRVLSRMSSALISYNDDIMKPLIDLSRVVATPRTPDSTTNLPEQIHAICSTVDECLIKYRIADAAARIEQTGPRMDLIHGALDNPRHIKMVDRFYNKHVNSATVFYLDGAATDIPRLNAEALGLLLTRDYLSNKS